MSHIICSHACDLRKFLEKITENRLIMICEYPFSGRTINRVKLTGQEVRPFKDDEIRKILKDYTYFRNFFTKQGYFPAWDNSTTFETKN